MLDGMRVVSFCHFLQGPAGVQHLADLGADVVKIEPPSGPYERHWRGGNPHPGGVSAFFLCANRNKRSLAVDLKHPDGKAVVMDLIARADVVVENFRAGVMDRLGFGFDAVRAVRPEIIYASASGWGSSGPMRDRPGQDLLVQARSGLMSVTGTGRPTPVGLAAVDQHGGALLAIGILAAYAKRLATGKGSRVETNLLTAALNLQNEPITLYLAGERSREVLERDPNLASWYHEAPYGVYRAKDCWIAVSMVDPVKLADALASEELAAAAALERYVERDAYARVFAAEIARHGHDELAPKFDALGVWYQRVQDYDDLASDPQVEAIEALREVDVNGTPVRLLAHPIRYDGALRPLRRLALTCGQHTREILAEIGRDEAAIEALIAAEVVAAPA